MIDLRDRIAELEHKQWAHWTKYMLDNLNDENINRWRDQIETPYSELSEKEKDADRKWADITLNLKVKVECPDRKMLTYKDGCICDSKPCHGTGYITKTLGEVEE